MAKSYKIKFRNFTWPHNPSSFNISFETRVIKHEYPDINGAETEDLGISPRIFSGSGAFYGPHAYENFRKLVIYAKDNKVGDLYHPHYGTFKARITKIASREEPLPWYVEYDFEFTEHNDITVIKKKVTKKPSSSGGSSNNKDDDDKKRYYVVKSGDNLSKISKKYYGTYNNWKKIADANKKLIKNPNVLKVGWKLYIPR
jgi:prophage DNA circulation protein